MKKKKIELNKKLVLHKEHMLRLESMDGIKGGATQATGQQVFCCVESTPTQPGCANTRIPTGCPSNSVVPTDCAFTNAVTCSQQITCPLQVNC